MTAPAGHGYRAAHGGGGPRTALELERSLDLEGRLAQPAPSEAGLGAPPRLPPTPGGVRPASRSILDVCRKGITSRDDYVVEFLGYRFRVQHARLRAAGERRGRQARSRRRRGARPGRDRRPRRVTAEGRIDDPRSGLGEYIVRHWERLSLVGEESLVYWLRKLVFRGAWLDHRVKERLLDWNGTTRAPISRTATRAVTVPSSSLRPSPPGTSFSSGVELGRCCGRRSKRSARRACVAARCGNGLGCAGQGQPVSLHRQDPYDSAAPCAVTPGRRPPRRSLWRRTGWRRLSGLRPPHQSGGVPAASAGCSAPDRLGRLTARAAARS